MSVFCQSLWLKTTVPESATARDPRGRHLTRAPRSPCRSASAALGRGQVTNSSGRSCLHSFLPNCTGSGLESEKQASTWGDTANPGRPHHVWRSTSGLREPGVSCCVIIFYCC